MEYAFIDFESLTIVLQRQRYWLEGRLFLLMAELLFAEGMVLTVSHLAGALGMRTRTPRDSLNRMMKPLQAKMHLKGQAKLLEQSRLGYRIVPPPAKVEG